MNIALPESPLSLHGCMDHPNTVEDAQSKNLALGTLRNLTGWEWCQMPKGNLVRAVAHFGEGTWPMRGVQGEKLNER